MILLQMSKIVVYISIVLHPGRRGRGLGLVCPGLIRGFDLGRS